MAFEAKITARIVVNRQAIRREISRKSHSALDFAGFVGRREIRKNVRPAPKTKRAQKRHVSLKPYYWGPAGGGLRQVRWKVYRRNTRMVVGTIKKSRTRFIRRTPSKKVTLVPKGPVPGIIERGGTVNVVDEYKSGLTVSRRDKYDDYPYVSIAFKRTLSAFKKALRDQNKG